MLRSGFKGPKQDSCSFEATLELLPSRLGSGQGIPEFEGVDPQLLSLLCERQLEASLPQSLDLHATRQRFARRSVVPQWSPWKDLGRGWGLVIP